MSETNPDPIATPKEGAILRLIQDKIASRLDELEKESNSQDALIHSLKTEVDALIQTGTTILAEMQENELQPKLNSKPDLKINLGNSIQNVKILAPQSSRDPKPDVPKTNDKPRRTSLKEKTGTSITDVNKQDTPSNKAGAGKTTPSNNTNKNVKTVEPKTGHTTTDSKKTGKSGTTHDSNKDDKGGKKAGAHEEEKTTENKEDHHGSNHQEDEGHLGIKALNKKNLTAVATMASPPAAILKIFEAVLTLIGEKSMTWVTAAKVAKSEDFVKRLGEVKAEAISDKNYKKVKGIVSEEDLQPEAIGKKSEAAKILAQWMISLVKAREAGKEEKKSEEDKVVAVEKSGEEKVEEKGEENAEKVAEEKQEEKQDEKQSEQIKVEEEVPRQEKPEEKHEEEKKEEVANDSENKAGTGSGELAAGMEGLKTLTKKQLSDVAAFLNPPPAVVKLMEGVLTVIGEKSTQWSTASKVIKGEDFVKRLSGVKVEGISDKNYKKVKGILAEEDMNGEAMAKKSAAGAVLLKWLNAVVKAREEIKGSEGGEEKNETEVKATPVTNTKKVVGTTGKKDDKKEENKKEHHEEAGKGKDKDNKDKEKDKKTVGSTATNANTAKDKGGKATTDKDNKDKDKNKEHKDNKEKDKEKDKTKTKEKEDKKTVGKGAEVKKGAEVAQLPAFEHTGELKAISDKISATNLIELKNMKHPPAAMLTTLQGISLLVQGKEHTWAEIVKTYFADLAALNKILAVDVRRLKKNNVEAASKKVSDASLESGVGNATSVGGILYKWVKTAIKLASPQQQGNEGKDSKEEVKEEEPKETANSSEHEEKDEGEKEKASEEVIQKKKVEESVDEKKEEEEHKTEKIEVKEEEEPVKNEEKAEVVDNNSHQEQVEEAQEQNGKEEKNGDAGDGEIASELGKVLGHEVNGGNARELLVQKIKEYKGELETVTRVREDLRKDNIAENPEKKPYEIKSTTKEFIQMVQQEWVSELTQNAEWDDKINQILVLLFMVQGYEGIPDVSEKNQLRTYAIEKLKKEEANLTGYLMGLEKNLDLDVERKIKIEKFLRDKMATLNPTSFDGLDALCGVISFLMKEACEHLGVVPMDGVKKAAVKEKISLLTQEKKEFYSERVSKLGEIANRHSISIDE